MESADSLYPQTQTAWRAWPWTRASPQATCRGRRTEEHVTFTRGLAARAPELASQIRGERAPVVNLGFEIPARGVGVDSRWAEGLWSAL